MRMTDDEWREQCAKRARWQRGSEIVSTAKADGAMDRADKLAPCAAASSPITLPWPPSGNTAVRHAQGVHYLRPEVIAYRDSVAAAVSARKPVSGRYIVHYHMSPPDARQRDMDNALKTLNDALVKCGYLPSDSMTFMRELRVTTDDARLGHIRVSVSPFPEAA